MTAGANPILDDDAVPSRDTPFNRAGTRDCYQIASSISYFVAYLQNSTLVQVPRSIHEHQICVSLGAARMAKKKTANCYAVRKGRTTGLFHSWAECEKSVKKYGGASYKGFLTTREAQIWLDTGEMVNATKFYGVVQGHTPGVYSSWAKAQEQVSGFHRPQHRSFETIEEATGYVAKERKIDQSEVFVARGHFDQLVNFWDFSQWFFFG